LNLFPKSAIERELVAFGLGFLVVSFVMALFPDQLLFVTEGQLAGWFLLSLGLGFLFSFLLVDRWRRKLGLPY
jgi:hypothetical protein